MRGSKLTLDLNDLGVESFQTGAERGVAAPEGRQESQLYYTVYRYYETEQLSCETCATCGGTDCWA